MYKCHTAGNLPRRKCEAISPKIQFTYNSKWLYLDILLVILALFHVFPYLSLYTWFLLRHRSIQSLSRSSLRRSLVHYIINVGYLIIKDYFDKLKFCLIGSTINENKIMAIMYMELRSIGTKCRKFQHLYVFIRDARTSFLINSIIINWQWFRKWLIVWD